MESLFYYPGTKGKLLGRRALGFLGRVLWGATFPLRICGPSVDIFGLEVPTTIQRIVLEL